MSREEEEIDFFKTSNEEEEGGLVTELDFVYLQLSLSERLRPIIPPFVTGIE